jgi:hypothetical protein
MVDPAVPLLEDDDTVSADLRPRMSNTLPHIRLVRYLASSARGPGATTRPYV